MKMKCPREELNSMSLIRDSTPKSTVNDEGVSSTEMTVAFR